MVFALSEIKVWTLRLAFSQSFEKFKRFPYKPRMIAGEIITNFRNPL